MSARKGGATRLAPAVTGEPPVQASAPARSLATGPVATAPTTAGPAAAAERSAGRLSTLRRGGATALGKVSLRKGAAAGTPAVPATVTTPGPAPTGPSTAGPTTTGPTTTGKGRPTPKRRDAEAERRARARPPRNRREAAERRRERSKVERETTRTAIATGDDRGLPARDRGPVKRFVRETVDGRRTVLEYVLPAMVVVLFGETALSGALARHHPGVLVAVQYGFYAVVLLILVLGWTQHRRLKAEIAARFADSGEETRGAAMYGTMRAVTIRRLRVPRPKRIS